VKQPPGEERKWSLVGSNATLRCKDSRVPPWRDVGERHSTLLESFLLAIINAPYAAWDVPFLRQRFSKRFDAGSSNFSMKRFAWRWRTEIEPHCRSGLPRERSLSNYVRRGHRFLTLRLSLI